MAHARPFLKLVASGTILGGEEIWSCGLTLIRGQGAGFESPAEMIGAATAATRKWFTSEGWNISRFTALTMVKLNTIGTDGEYADKGNTVLQEVKDVVGPGAGDTPLPQITVACSLLTDATRGRGSRGRFYPPTPRFAVTSTGRVGLEQAQLAAAASAQWVKDLNAITPLWRVGVSSDIGEGVQRPVTAVRVGDVFDTQRRRRSALKEVYREALVAP